MERYLGIIFDENVGMLTSDMSQVSTADDCLVIPPVLTRCSYPLIVISTCALDIPRSFNDSKNWAVISVRTGNIKYVQKVTSAIEHVFGNRYVTLYPST